MSNKFSLTETAIRQYADIGGFENDQRGLAAAKIELESHCANARLVGENRNSIIYRTGRVKVGSLQKSTRLELFVRPHSQLVEVRDKGRGIRGANTGEPWKKRKFGDKYIPRSAINQNIQPPAKGRLSGGLLLFNHKQKPLCQKKPLPKQTNSFLLSSANMTATQRLACSRCRMIVTPSHSAWAKPG
jgi:hypothetical protein